MSMEKLTKTVTGSLENLKDLIVNPEESGKLFLEKWNWIITTCLFVATGVMVGINFVTAHFIGATLMMLIFMLAFPIMSAMNIGSYLIFAQIGFKIAKTESIGNKLKAMSWFYLIPQLIMHLIIWVVINVLIVSGNAPYSVIAYDYLKWILYFWILASTIAYLYSIDENQIFKHSIIVTIAFFANSALNTYLNWYLVSLLFTGMGG